MNQLLNGTAWGELPQQKQELLIPEFMDIDYKTYSFVVPCSAYEARAAGRVKHSIRAEKKQRRDFKNGIAYIGILAGLLALANIMMEVMLG